MPTETGPRTRFYVRALSYFRPDLPLILLLLAVIGLSTLAGLLQVWPMAILIDSVLTPTPKQGGVYERLLMPLTGDSRHTQILILAALTLVLRLLQELLNMARSLLSLQINQNGLLRVRCELFQKLQALHLRFHHSQSQGDTIYRLSNDTQGFEAILNVLIEVAVAASTLLIMLSILLSRSVELTLIALAIAPLLLIVNVWYGRILKSKSLDAAEVESNFTSTVQRSISSISLIQAFSRETVEYDRFRHSADETNGAWYRFQYQASCYRLCVGLIFGTGAAMIFWYGGGLVYQNQFVSSGAGGMTVGDLMIFSTYLGMFYDPLCKISGAGANIQGGVVGAERVFKVLDRETQVTEAEDAISLPRRPRDLTLVDTGFAYEPGKIVLQDVNVRIKPGQMVAFVGSSGVGKTTLLNLLPRFFDPTEGALELDGYDLRQVKLRDLRKHIALVLQDSMMLPATVAENIAYGRWDATEAEIRRAAQLAGADTFIESLPNGYKTQVTEGGKNLSGGQRQRIAIARALLTEAPILVLDEPTSALDSEHEQLITDTLDGLKRKKTIILVSHRLSTVVNCDRIFVMEGGRIVERGTHRDLLEKRGTYYRMARHQFDLGDDFDDDLEEAAQYVA